MSNEMTKPLYDFLTGDNKPFKLDEVREWIRQYDKEDISLSKFVELLNIRFYESMPPQQPVSITDYEIEMAAAELGKQSTAPDKETPDWMLADIKRGIRWAIKEMASRLPSPQASPWVKDEMGK